MTKLARVFWVFLVGFNLSAAQANPPQKVELALNWKPEPEFGGFYTAQINKIDLKNGIELKILQGGSGEPTVQMVAAGKIPFAIASAEEIVMAQDRGADVVALFAVYQTHPMGLMVHESSGIKSISEIFDKNLTLSIQKGLPPFVFLEKKFGFSKVKTVPYTGGVANFLHNPNLVQQCFITSEPLAAQKAGAKTRSFLIADLGFNPYTTLLITQRSLIKKDPELVKKMVRITLEGWTEYLKDPKATNALMHRLNDSMSMSTFDEIAENQKDLIIPKLLGKMTLERWTTLADQMRDLGLVKKKIDARSYFFSIE